MEVILNLAGTPGLTDLHMGVPLPAVLGELILSGNPSDVAGIAALIPTNAGELTLVGYPVDVTGVAFDIEVVEGALSLIGYPAEAQSWTYFYSPDGELSIVGNPSDVTIGLRFAPFNIWPNYRSDGTNITIPISELLGLSASEADTITGDWREIFQSMLLDLTAYLDYDRDNAFHIYDRPVTTQVFLLEDWNRQTPGEMSRSIKVKFAIQYAMQKITEEPI